MSSDLASSRLGLVRVRLQSLDVSFKAFLFGSAARNEMDQYSDIDVYVIFRTKEDLKSSSRQLYSASVDLLFPIDWILTTEEEHEKNAKIGGLAYSIANEGLLFCEVQK